MNNDLNDGWLVFMVIIIACALTAVLTAAMIWDETKRAAIENNCGRYNAETGAFEWVRQQPLPAEKSE
jgi:hypothetical protein